MAGLLCGLMVTAVACDRGGEKRREKKAPVPPLAQSKQPAGVDVEGTVAEVLEGGGFTFLRIKTADGEKWASVPQVSVKKGEKVKLIDAFPFPKFHSKSLNRTFDEMIFASAIEGKQAVRPHFNAPTPAAEKEKGKGSAKGGDSFTAAMAESGGASPGAPQTGSAAAVVKKTEITVDRAPGSNGFTVAELFAKAAELNGKKVLVNGKVVKVSRNIMGRNWIHIQDGTGDSSGKNHDLVVTSADAPEKDKMVQVEGIMKANKDFGSGYRYAALVEEAKFVNLAGK